MDIEQSWEFQAFFACENTVLNALREVADEKISIRTLQQEMANCNEIFTPYQS